MTLFEEWARVPQKQPRTFTAVVLAVVVALTWIIYKKTTSYEYLDWDDNTLVEQNILVTDPSWARTWEMWVPHRIPGPHLPLRSTSYRVDLHILAKGVPPAQKPNYIHIVNVWLYALNGVLLFFVMRKLLNPWAAAIGTLIWVAHPLHVEGVAWVSGRKEMLSGAFILGGFLLYVAGTHRLKKSPALAGVGIATALAFATIVLHKIWEAKFQSTPFAFGLTSLALLMAAPFAYAQFTNTTDPKKWSGAGMHAGSVLCTLCALLSKPVSIAIPPILLFWELGYRPNKPETPEEWAAAKRSWWPLPTWLPTWPEVTALWARLWPHTALVLWGMYMTYERGLVSQVVKDTTWNAAPKNPWISGLSALWLDVYHLVAPLHLSALYDVKSDRWYPAAIAGALILAALPVLLYLVIRKSPKSLPWIGFFVFPILPVAGFIPIAAAHADRYLYLPAIALAAGLGVLLSTAAFGTDEETGEWERWLAAGLSVAIIVGFSALSFERTNKWGKDHLLWGDAVANNPDLPSARNNYGAALMNAGFPSRPCEPAKKAAEQGPLGRLMHGLKHGFGNAPDVIDNCIQGGALEQYYKAYQFLPTLDVAQFNIAATEFRLGRPERAEKYCAEFVAQHPAMPTGWILCGQIKQARAKQLSVSAPADAEMKMKEALEHFEKGCFVPFDEFAVLQNMDKVSACNQLAITRAGANDVEGAFKAFDEGLRASPQNRQLHLNRIRYLRQLKRFDEALVQLDVLGTIAPNDIEVIRGYAVTHFDLGNYDRAAEYIDMVVRSPRVTQADVTLQNQIKQAIEKAPKKSASRTPAAP